MAEEKRLIYVDANVFINLYLEPDDRKRPLKDFSFDFLARGRDCAFSIVVSDFLKYELGKKLTEEEIEETFSVFRKKDKLVFVKEENERAEAKKISSNWQDVLHALLAKKAGAECFATYDVGAFESCKEIIKVSFPEAI